MNFTTSASLLGRLRDPDDSDAWDRFYEHYTPLIIGFCRQRGCSLAAAHDVVQETMSSLLRRLPTFSYNPDIGRFRSYLLRIVDARIKDAYRRRRKYMALEGGGAVEEENTLEVPDEDYTPPWEVWEKLWRYNVLLRALEKTKVLVNPQTFRCFELYVLQGMPASRVSADLAISRNTVYQHRARVIKILQREARKLELESGG